MLSTNGCQQAPSPPQKNAKPRLVLHSCEWRDAAKEFACRFSFGAISKEISMCFADDVLVQQQQHLTNSTRSDCIALNVPRKGSQIVELVMAILSPNPQNTAQSSTTTTQQQQPFSFEEFAKWQQLNHEDAVRPDSLKQKKDGNDVFDSSDPFFGSLWSAFQPTFPVVYSQQSPETEHKKPDS